MTSLRGAGAGPVPFVIAHPKTASIEVNATDFRADLTQYRRQLTDRQIAQIYFGDFMARIGAHLIGVFNNANTRSKF